MAETEKVTQISELTTGREVTGTVKKLELYGAFVDIGVGQDALLHISQLGKNVRNIEDALKVGDTITARLTLAIVAPRLLVLLALGVAFLAAAMWSLKRALARGG